MFSYCAKYFKMNMNLGEQCIMTVWKNEALFLSKVYHSQDMSLVRVLMINSDIVRFLYADQMY